MIDFHPVAAAYLSHLEGSGRSRATVRQRAWALRRLAAAAQQAGTGADPLALVQAAPAVHSELEGAGASLATRRALEATVSAFSAFAGVEVGERPRLPAVPLRSPLGPAELRAVAVLATTPLRGVLREDRVRAAAVIALCALTGLNGLGLCGLRRDDVDLAQGTLTPGGVTPTPLPGWARTTLRAWVEERDALVARLEGSSAALLVAVRPNHDPRTRRTRPAGLPLHPRGLQRSFSRVARAANLQHVGEPGFPLPTSLTWVRRSQAAARRAAAPPA
ncbi:MAG: hypothetical protein U0Q15_13600 [Kineosporiaceae bacterium]